MTPEPFPEPDEWTFYGPHGYLKLVRVRDVVLLHTGDDPEVTDDAERFFARRSPGNPMEIDRYNLRRLRDTLTRVLAELGDADDDDPPTS